VRCIHPDRRSLIGPAYVRGLVIVAALIAVAGVALTAGSAQNAQAEAGRRICKYLWMQDVGNPEGRSVSFVTNYEKDGACPTADYRKVQIPKQLGAWMPSPDPWEEQPAPKMTCEEFENALHLSSTQTGGDVCTTMFADELCGATSWLASDPVESNSVLVRVWGLGSVWNLGS
jgi:hypothetical protein